MSDPLREAAKRVMDSLSERSTETEEAMVQREVDRIRNDFAVAHTFMGFGFGMLMAAGAVMMWVIVFGNQAVRVALVIAGILGICFNFFGIKYPKLRKWMREG